MKKHVFYSNFAVLLCGVSLFFSACSQNSGKTETTETEDHSGHNMEASGTNKMMDLMHENMTAMQEIKLTGDLDHDFAQLMAIHHEGALTMAQEEIDNGQDSMLVNMAKKTLSDQKAEKEKLQNFISSHQPVTADTAASMKLMKPMKTMMAQMNHNMKGTTDHHFASLMTMHHQSGIDMAKAYLAQAKFPEIKAIAQNIMNEQQKEKQQLDNWLQEHPQQ